MHDRIVILVALLIMPLIVGCAQIRSFSVAPSTVCPGETIKIDWQVSGNSDVVTLKATPPLKGTEEVATEGSQFLIPMHSTRFVLKAPGLLKSDQREWDVLVIPSQSSRLLGGVAQCDGNPQSVLTSFTIQQKDTSARIRAVSIENNYHRPLSVSKGGVEVEIPPGGATDGFKNIPAIGTWAIRMPVTVDEACENVLEAVAGRLTIKTQMSCEE